MPAAQTYKNHTRFDPAFHFFLAPLSLANVIRSIYITYHRWPNHAGAHLWWVAMSLVIFVAVGTIRRYAAQNQDRIIRLEERMRYAAILTPASLVRTESLTLRQIISLRFASDAELPALIERTLGENLNAKQIKQGIVTWRPDYNRI